MITKHLILGKGSLCFAIKEEIENRPLHHYYNPSSFKYPTSLIDLKGYDFIWNTVGNGSVGSDFNTSLEAHVQLAQYLVDNVPEYTTVINFSSNYVAEENLSNISSMRTTRPRSLYALSKKMMEECLIVNGKNNHKAIRIANLYGPHFPERGLPHRLIKNQPSQLATNEVIPTPTGWLALKLFEKLDQIRESDTVTSLAPRRSLPLNEFANLIGLNTQPYGIDHCRPLLSNIGNDYNIDDTVEKCWYESEYKKLFL